MYRISLSISICSVEVSFAIYCPGHPGLSEPRATRGAMRTQPLTPRAMPPRSTRRPAPSGGSSDTDLVRAVCLFGGLFVLANILALSYFVLPHPEMHSHLFAHRQSRAAAAATAAAEKAAVMSSRQHEEELSSPPPPPPPSLSPPPPPPPQQTSEPEQNQKPETEPTFRQPAEPSATDT
jgi:hypothetical protein